MQKIRVLGPAWGYLCHSLSTKGSRIIVEKGGRRLRELEVRGASSAPDRAAVHLNSHLWLQAQDLHKIKLAENPGME